MEISNFRKFVEKSKIFLYKLKHFLCKMLIFSANFWKFEISQFYFFHHRKKYFCWSWKKIVNSFDAEKAYLSIGGIFRAIRALQRERPGKHCQNLWISASIHVYTIASSYIPFFRPQPYISLWGIYSIWDEILYLAPSDRHEFGGFGDFFLPEKNLKIFFGRQKKSLFEKKNFFCVSKRTWNVNF